MWEWKASSGSVVWIPRKPIPEGVKIQTCCLELTRSGEPYCFYMRPDIAVSKFGAETIVTDVLAIMRRHQLNTLVMDCWYFTKGVLQSYPDVAITVACAADDMPSLAKVSTSGLQHHQFRMFQSAHLIYSIFADVSIVRVLSSAFTISAAPPRAVIARTGMSTASLPTSAEILHTIPLLSESGLAILQTLSLDDVRALGARMGVSIRTYACQNVVGSILTSNNRGLDRVHCKAHCWTSSPPYGQCACTSCGRSQGRCT